MVSNWHCQCSLLIHWWNLISEFDWFYIVILWPICEISFWIFENQSIAIQLHWMLNSIKNWLQQLPEFRAPKAFFNWISHFTFVEIWDMRHDMWTIQKCIQILKIEKIFQIPLYAVLSNSVPQCSACNFSHAQRVRIHYKRILNDNAIDYQVSTVGTKFKRKDEIPLKIKIYLAYYNRIPHSTSAFAFQNSHSNFNLLTFSLKLNIELRTHLRISFRSTIEFGHLIYFEHLFYANQLLCWISVTESRVTSTMKEWGSKKRFVWNGVFMDGAQYVVMSNEILK